MSSSLDLVGDYLWDRALSRAVDHATSASFGLSAAVLMEVAGKGVADWLVTADLVGEAPVLVLAGYGNNGGDALVAARWLAEAGAEVQVFLVPSGRGQQPEGLCAAQLKTFEASGFKAEVYKKGVFSQWRRAEPVILDGVYGLGFKGPLERDSLAFAALSEAAALPDTTIVAIDVPSGLDCDDGAEQELPLKADVTLTFGGKKPALVLAPARDGCGEVMTLAVGFPTRALEQALEHGLRPAFMLPDVPALIGEDPWATLPRSAHKYERGHVLIIGGSAGKTGAPLLAGQSALRAGCGWVSIAMPKGALDTLKGDVPRELVFEDLFSGGEQLNSLALAKFLQERRVRAVVIGPGMVDNPLTPEVLAELVEAMGEEKEAGRQGQRKGEGGKGKEGGGKERPGAKGVGLVVLDAAATNGVYAMLQGLELDPERWLLTPHPGEWAKLGVGLEAPLTAAGALKAKAAAAELGVTLMYKGATPVVLSGPQEMPSFVADAGTLALARAGSGDLFAGAAGAHGAIGVGAVVSALRAQTVIGWAARLATKKVGEHAVLAKDVLGHMGKVAEHIAALELGED